MVLHKDLIQDKYFEEKKGNVSLRKNKDSKKGLCTSCNRSDSCALSHSVNDSIWDCEDFDDNLKTDKHFVSITEKQTNSRSEEKRLPGLCGFCLNKNNCSLKSMEGGIWHCEEYI